MLAYEENLEESPSKFGVELAAAIENIRPLSYEVRKSQDNILSQLPENLVEEMYAHILAVDTENEHYGYGAISSERELMAVIRGELFERLVYIEETDALYTEAGQSDRYVADEFLALLRNPERFNFGHAGRNPDLAVIDVEKMRIVGVMDAKLGLLDDRAYKQAKGFAPNIKNTLRQLSTALEEEGEENFVLNHGLSPSVAQLRRADKIQRFFIVPRDRDIDPEKLVAFTNYAGDPAFTYEEDRNEFIEKIKGGQIEVKRAVFSTKEVAQMASVVRLKLKEEYGF